MDRAKIAWLKGYRVKEDGRVFSHYGNKMSARIGPKGYRTFGVKHEGRTLTITVARLQAYQKFGEALFEEGQEVRHRNGNSTDDSYENILIGTRHENIMDRTPESRKAHAKHASSRMRRFNDKEREEIREFHRKCKSYKKTMERFNISSKGTLHYILSS